MCRHRGSRKRDDREDNQSGNAGVTETDLDPYESLERYTEPWRAQLEETKLSVKEAVEQSRALASQAIDRSTRFVDDWKSKSNPSWEDNNLEDDLFLKDVKNLDKFIGSVTGGLISNPFNINYKPLNDKSTGYWAYPSPSSDIYDACKEKNGLSVWDEQGYWRCLFPKAVIPPEKLGKVLTKEDVLDDKKNQHGLFFQDFNKYLDWKSNMKRVLREERAKKLEELKQQQQQQRRQSDTFDFSAAKKGQFDSLNTTNQIEQGKKVVSTKEYFSSYESNGELNETRKIFEYYEDGSSAKKESTRRIDKRETDKKPVVEERVEKFPAKRSGWFWDNSEK